MARDLDTEDRIRDLQGRKEWADMLAAAEPFHWFLGLVERQIDYHRSQVEVSDHSTDLTNRHIGAIRGLRWVLSALDGERSNLASELQAQGVGCEEDHGSE